MKGYYKIRELAESAPFTTVSSEGRLFSQQDMIQFAELIVRECAEQVKSLRVNDYGISGEEIIKEHFGIEE